MDATEAKTDAAPEVQLTPAQLAEIEENKRPFLDKFKDLITEAEGRLQHGTTLTQTFVDALKALYDEAERGGAPGSKQTRQLSPAELQVRADRAAKRAADQKRLDDAKAAEKQAEDDLAQDGTDV